MSVQSFLNFYNKLFVSLERASKFGNPERIINNVDRLERELIASKCYIQVEPDHLIAGLRCLTVLENYRLSLGRCKLFERVISMLEPSIEQLSDEDVIIVQVFKEHFEERIKHLGSEEPEERIKPFIEKIYKAKNELHQIYFVVSCLQETLAWMAIYGDTPSLKATLTKCLDVLNTIIGLRLSPGEYDVVRSAILKVDDLSLYSLLIGYKE